MYPIGLRYSFMEGGSVLKSKENKENLKANMKSNMETCMDKKEELKKMSADELNAKLKDLKEELFTLRFQHAINQLDNPQRMVEVKRNIARVMTILSEKNA